MCALCMFREITKWMSLLKVSQVIPLFCRKFNKKLLGSLGRIALLGSYQIWLARRSQEWSGGDLIKANWTRTTMSSLFYQWLCLFSFSDNQSICVFLARRSLDVLNLNGNSPSVWASVGLSVRGSNVPQGSGLSPICFSLIINEIVILFVFLQWQLTYLCSSCSQKPRRPKSQWKFSKCLGICRTFCAG